MAMDIRLHGQSCNSLPQDESPPSTSGRELSAKATSHVQDLLEMKDNGADRENTEEEKQDHPAEKACS
jgi:hypothetical protein